MHVHETPWCSGGGTIRTTVEIRDDLRARLLEMAGRQGQKGFSRLVEQAIERFVDAEAGREKTRRLALAARGTLGRAEADDLAERSAGIRETWR